MRNLFRYDRHMRARADNAPDVAHKESLPDEERGSLRSDLMKLIWKAPTPAWNGAACMGSRTTERKGWVERWRGEGSSAAEAAKRKVRGGGRTFGSPSRFCDVRMDVWTHHQLPSHPPTPIRPTLVPSTLLPRFLKV